MNEIQISNFDYSIVDQSTAEFLEDKSYKIHGIAESMRTKIGKELKEVQSKLANNYQGVFAKWYESMGLDKNTVYYWINVYEFSRNLEDTNQLENFTNAPKSLQKETMKKTTPKELKEKVLSGDIKTNKKFKELEQQLKQEQQARQQAEQDNEKLGQLLTEERNKEPKVIEKEVVKEVIPNHVKKQIEERERIYKATVREYEQLQDELNLLKAKTASDNEKEKKEKEVKLLMLDASKSVLKTKIKIDEFLQEVAVTPYRRGAIASSSEGTKNKLREGVNELKAFCEEMEMALDGTIEHQK